MRIPKGVFKIGAIAAKENTRPRGVSDGGGRGRGGTMSGGERTAGTVHYHKLGATPEWETPAWLFDRLNARFGFTLDACATADNAKCSFFYTRTEDGLAQPWTGVVWMNPPYGREIRAWMRKAYESAVAGATVVCLVPARTDAGWWHDYAARGDVTFVRGRVRFSGWKVHAPFPSAVVVFWPGGKARGDVLTISAAGVA